MDYINDLHELCETISKEIGEANDKIRNAGGKLSAGDVDYIDKLTHTLKSVKATIAMMEGEDGYSGYNGGSYRYSRDGGSYAPRRDSMGRYSRRGYSRSGDLAEQLHGLMQDAPNDQIRREIQRLADKVESM